MKHLNRVYWCWPGWNMQRGENKNTIMMHCEHINYNFYNHPEMFKASLFSIHGKVIISTSNRTLQTLQQFSIMHYDQYFQQTLYAKKKSLDIRKSEQFFNFGCIHNLKSFNLNLILVWYPNISWEIDSLIWTTTLNWSHWF